jgi:hypothetical protein
VCSSDLGLVTQRPAELDPTILSQCSTLFAMRMANDRDQAIVRSAVSDAAANLLSFVPTLGTREVFAFGEGVALPTRLRFGRLPADAVPRSEALGNARHDVERGVAADFVDSVIERRRGATMSSKQRPEDLMPDLEPLVRGESVVPRPSQGLGPDRFRILKKALDDPGSPLAPEPGDPFGHVRR